MKIRLFVLVMVLSSAVSALALDATKPSDQSLIGGWPALLRETRAAVNSGAIPVATTTTAGKVKPDGVTITVDVDGTIHSSGGGVSQVAFDNRSTTQAATDAAQDEVIAGKEPADVTIIKSGALSAATDDPATDVAASVAGVKAVQDAVDGLALTNLTALRAVTTGSAQPSVYLEGHTTSGDGGGGKFRYTSGQPPGTYADNGGTVIVPTGGDGSAAWLRDYTGAVNVKWFGASPSATRAANVTAIQAAVDLAAAVVATTSVATVDLVTAAVELDAIFPINAAIRLKNGVVLVGTSRSTSGLDHTGATDAVDTDAVTYKHGTGLRNMTIIGDGLDSRYGVNGWGLIRSCFVEDVLFDGFQDNIHLSSSWTMELRHVQAQNARRYNVYGDGLTNGRVLGGRYDTAGSHSIYIENATVNTEGLKITGTAVQASQGGGIVFDGIKQAVVEGCFLEALAQGGNTHAYIHADMDGTGSVEIVNNYINKGGSGGDGKAAAFIDGVKNFTYIGNTSQSQAVGLEIGTTAEAGTVLESTFGNTTRYTNNSTGNISIKEGAKAPLVLGPDMNDGSFSYDKASAVFGDWNAGAPRYLALGPWSGIPAIQAGGSGTSNKLRINPSAGNVEVAFNTGGEVWTGQTVLATTNTTSNVTVDTSKGFFGVDCSAGNRTATLSATLTAGREVVVAKRDTSANTLTITPSSGLIDGAASLVLSTTKAVRLICDGTNWFSEAVINSADLGTAAFTPSSDYATAAQGATADSALQPGDIGSTVQSPATTLAGYGITDGVIATGKAGGQTVTGGTGAGDLLLLGSTSHGTKNGILFDDRVFLDTVYGRMLITMNPNVKSASGYPASKLTLVAENTSGADDAGVRQEMFSTASAFPSTAFFRARGTFASPSKVLSEDRFGGIAARGYYGVAGSGGQFAGSGTAAIFFNSEEDFNDSTHLGTRITFETTPMASGTRAEAMRIHGSKGVSIGNTTDPGANNLSVTGTISGLAPEVVKTSSATLTTAEVSGTILSQAGQSVTANSTLTLPTAAAGMSFVLDVGTLLEATYYTEVKAGTNDKIYFDDVAGVNAGSVRATAQAIGTSLSCRTFKTDAYDWMCRTVTGTWEDF